MLLWCAASFALLVAMQKLTSVLSYVAFAIREARLDAEVARKAALQRERARTRAK
jgi:hypothetical protein